MSCRNIVVALLFLTAFATRVRAVESRFNNVLLHAEVGIAEANLKRSLEQTGGLGGEQPPAGPDLTAELAEARQAFFEAYRTRVKLPEAAARFSELLARKDAALLWNELWLAGVPAQQDTYRQLLRVDGGIIPGAQREFNDWVEVITSKADDGGGPIGQRIRRVQLIGRYTKYQEAYVAARWWSEFDRAQIQLAPHTFVWMMVQRYPIPKAPEAAKPNFNAIVELFGEERLAEVATKLIPLRRDTRNNCTGLEKIGLDPAAKELTGRKISATRDVRPLDPAHAYVVFLALLARDNPQRGFLADSYRGAHNATDDQDWVRLRDQYRRLVLAYGQKRVDETAEKCATAGANVWHQLARDNLDGYLHFTLADGETLDTQKAIDARLAELTAHAGEASVREVATRVRDAHIAGDDLKQFGTGLGDPCSAIVSMLRPPAPNNPWYRAWSHFPVGSKAVYKERRKDEVAFTRELTFELLSVDPKTIVVKSTVAEEHYGSVRERNERIEYPATVDPMVADIPGWPARPFTPFLNLLHYSGVYGVGHSTTSVFLTGLDPAPDSYEAAGQSFQCTKRIGTKPPTYAEMVWMSDQVPGGVVRIEAINGRARLDDLARDLLVLKLFEGKPAARAAAAKDTCLNCAMSLEAGATQCKICHVAIGPDPEVQRVKKLFAEHLRQTQEQNKQKSVPRKAR